MFTVADVVLDGVTVRFDRKYSYLLPDAVAKDCVRGMRVLVPFGRANRKMQGVLADIRQTAEADGLKSILSVIDKTPVLNDEMLRLCEWIREQTFCTYYDAIHAVLPAGINFRLVETYSAVQGFLDRTDSINKEIYAFLLEKGKAVPKETVLRKFSLENDLPLEELRRIGAVQKEGEAVRRISDATMKMVHLREDVSDTVCRTPQQNEVIRLLSEIGDVSVKEITYFAGVGASVITTLQKHGVVEVYEKEAFRLVRDFAPNGKRREIVLTKEQQTAFDRIRARLSAENGSCTLLYGVTGSGKTQVFLKLVDEVFDRGEGSIVMVPEISLTPQTLSLFGARYGNRVAVFHSAMSLGQRLDEWKRVKNGDALVAVGTRSAVFAPFEKLGLIIMDEEQEHTYKSEQSPRFHARNVAKFRANYHHSVLLLASATPSMESYSAALGGKYELETLTKRYGNAILPQVDTVDMRAEITAGNSGTLSRRLAEALTGVLAEKKQAILLLNRRGYNTYVSCPSCGYVATCPNCSITMTYHSANKRLMCHYCGHSEPTDRKCPDCGAEQMRFYGMGTQKVEEELHGLFSEARILRLDADSTMTRGAFNECLGAFAKGEYDILLGTQMVAKGLDFSNVTLVGVIGADQAMYSEDYRSFERTFSLLTQVVGRAGRGELAGKAIVQTNTPDSELIRLAVNQDYDAFYHTEILTRKMMIYPPYCDMALVAASSAERVDAWQAISDIFDNIKNQIAGDYRDVHLVILGPSAAAVPRVGNRYRFRMFIKCKNNSRFRALLRTAMQVKLKNDTSVFVDINPETVV